MDPDSTGTGPFRLYLNSTKNVIIAGGYDVTTDENRMNVYVFQAPAPPDVAVLGLTVSKTVVGQGYSVDANVTVENEGVSAESFNLTISANTTAILSQIVVVESSNSSEITVVWNTTGLARAGNYVMSVRAEPLAGELDTADNNFTGGTVHVGIIGDVNADGKVDMKDIDYVARRFLVSPSDPLWNSNADINGDNKVDKNDIDATARQFGQGNEKSFCSHANDDIYASFILARIDDNGGVADAMFTRLFVRAIWAL